MTFSHVQFFMLMSLYLHFIWKRKKYFYSVSLFHWMALEMLAAQFREALDTRFPDFKPSIAGGDLIN